MNTATDLSDQAIAQAWRERGDLPPSNVDWEWIRMRAKQIDDARELQAQQGRDEDIVGLDPISWGADRLCEKLEGAPAPPSRGDDGWRLLLAAADNIDELANRMPPPNQWTPQFMMLAVNMRSLAHNRLSHRGAVDDLLRRSLPLIAFAYDKGVFGADELGRDIEAALGGESG